VTNGTIDKATAEAIQELFFEVLIAPAYEAEALAILTTKKNRILLETKPGIHFHPTQKKSILNGSLEQGLDTGNYTSWEEVGARPCTETEKADLLFGNIICKHLKSNAIALIKNKQLVGKGCGQTSRIDALRQAIEKAKQFNFELKGASLASDAFFPFDDCVKIAQEAGIEAFIQPGGSVRDKDSIAYINGTNICSGNGTCIINTGNNSNISLDDYAKLDGTTGSFYDSSFKDSISTALRILYNQDGNPLCTWHNALGTGFDCVTLSQNGNTVLDTSNFVSYVNETYGNNYCENTTSIVIGAYDDC
jgi:hypothetical protein